MLVVCVRCVSVWLWMGWGSGWCVGQMGDQSCVGYVSVLWLCGQSGLAAWKRVHVVM